MSATLLCLLATTAVLTAQDERQEPIDAAIEGYFQAREAGHFEEATAKREQARALIAKLSPNDEHFERRVTNLAQIYESAGKALQARSILEQAVVRSSGSTRAVLLNALANSWEQDQSLLKSAMYREQAVAAYEAQPLERAGEPFPPQVELIYQQLMGAYRQLGRFADAEAVRKKILAKAIDKDSLRASLYEQDGKFDEAAEIYRRQADQIDANPQRRVEALQALARLSQMQQQPLEAAAFFEQAARVMASSDSPDARSQTTWIDLARAGLLAQAGQVRAADELYRQLLRENEGQPTYLQILPNYATHLATSDRGPEAATLLEDCLGELQGFEQVSIIFALANTERLMGNATRADEYQRRAMEKQRALQPEPQQRLIGPELERAQAAAVDGKVHEAVELAIAAMAEASQAIDREQVAWEIPSTAGMLAAHKAPEEADRLYGVLFALVQSWSAESPGAVFNAQQQYVRYLMQQHRWRDVPAAIDRYRDSLVAARGANSGLLDSVLRLKIEAQLMQSSPANAVAAAQDLLAFQESLNGTASEPYLRALETAASVFEQAGDFGRAVPLRLSAIPIVDGLTAPGDARRGFMRMNAASTLARVKRFDDAERLAGEAIAISERMRPLQPEIFRGQLEQIRQMKAADGAEQAKPDANSRWFDRPGLRKTAQ